MTQSANTLEEKLSSTSSIHAFEMLMINLICILLVWCAQYYWKRRKLYRAAAQRKGPFAFPLIGNALHFLGSNEDIFNKLLSIIVGYESPLPIWLGPRLFFGVWKPSQLEIILNSPHALEKEKMYKFLVPAVGDGLFTASVPKWRRHKKIIMPTFNQKNLDEFVEIFANQAQVLVEKLKKESGKGIFDIFSYVSRCTLDTFCETAMGVSVNAQTTESKYIQWANRALGIIFARMCNICYHSDFIFNRSSMAKELHEICTKMQDFTGTVVEKRKAYQKQLKKNKERPEVALEEGKRKRRKFLHQLLEKSDEGGNFTDVELREEVDTFMFGGSDTTATTTCFILMVLGMLPDIQNRVYEEVMDVLGPDRPVECEDLGKLHYSERVIKEAVRLFPVAPFMFRAIAQDIHLDNNCIIPAGCGVFMSIISVQRDPNIWPDCFKFDPDRFLAEEVAKRHPYSWIPFSGGLRSCPGPKYAMMSMKTLIATVTRKYRLFTDYNSIEDIKLKSYVVLKPVNGYRLSVQLRQ